MGPKEDEYATQRRRLDDSTKLDYFENLRTQASNVQRVGNLDIVTNDDDGSQLGFCHFVHMIPLSRVDSDGKRQRFMFWEGHKQVAAVHLAVRHLNTGDGSVVKDVEGLDKRCKIRFTVEPSDTMLAEVQAVKDTMSMVNRVPVQERLPCAFIGASRSAVSIPMSIITSTKGYPQLSARSTSVELDDKSQHKLFGRTIPSDDGTSFSALQFLSKLNVKHLCILQVNDSYGNEFARALHLNAKTIDPDMKIVPIEFPARSPTPQDFEIAINLIASTEYRYVFAIVYGSMYNDLMTEAYRQGVAGPGYSWIFGDALSISSITSQQFELGSPLHIATQGVSILYADAGDIGMDGYDRYSDAMRSFDNDDDISYLDSLLPQIDGDPINEETSVRALLAPSIKSTTAVYVYDATIALGLSACNLSMTQERLSQNSTIAWNGGGESHFNQTIYGSAFDGASGSVRFRPSTGSRDPDSAYFLLTNFVAQEDLDPVTGKVQFKAVESQRFEHGSWQTITPYVFSDGTTFAHPDLPPLNANFMYIGTPIRSVGLLLSAITMSMTIGFSIWTYQQRNGKVVQVSQPSFLYKICLGNFLMAASVIPLSFDDEIASNTACSIACMITYWLFWIGFGIAFSAMFGKTTRLKRSSISGRRAPIRLSVRKKEWTRHLVLILLVNIIFLSAWTAFSPLKWERIESQLDRFGRPRASYGHCASQHDQLFVILLGATNFAFVLVSLYQVHRGRAISNEFHETKYMTLAIAGMLLVSLMAVPLIIIASDNPGAHFFVLSCTNFVICNLFLLPIFVPKLRFQSRIGTDNENEDLQSASTGKVIYGKYSMSSDDCHGSTTPTEVQSCYHGHGTMNLNIDNSSSLSTTKDIESNSLPSGTMEPLAAITESDENGGCRDLVADKEAEKDIAKEEE